MISRSDKAYKKERKKGDDVGVISKRAKQNRVDIDTQLRNPRRSRPTHDERLGGKERAYLYAYKYNKNVSYFLGVCVYC